MTTSASRCLDCGAAFRTRDPVAALCPGCQSREDRMCANDETLAADADTRLAMQERLSVEVDT